LALSTTPQGQQQQQRTFDVLRKPDIFKSYRHIQQSSLPLTLSVLSVEAVERLCEVMR